MLALRRMYRRFSVCFDHIFHPFSPGDEPVHSWQLQGVRPDDRKRGVPNSIQGTAAFIVSSGEEWKAGVNSLVQKHQAMISRDLTQDSRRADKRRLAIEDLDPTDPVNASNRQRVVTEVD